MEEDKDKNVVNHFEAGSNCQVFNAPISGCVFAMPGSTVTQNTLQPVRDLPKEQSPNEKGTPLNPPIKGEDNPCPLATEGSQEGATEGTADELCHFVHPSVDSSQEWQIHNEIKRLVKRQRIQEICQYLLQLKKENKVLLPQSPSAAYEELVRLGMPNGEGFNESTFRKYYSNK